MIIMMVCGWHDTIRFTIVFSNYLLHDRVNVQVRTLSATHATFVDRGGVSVVLVLRDVEGHSVGTSTLNILVRMCNLFELGDLLHKVFHFEIVLSGGLFIRTDTLSVDFIDI